MIFNSSVLETNKYSIEIDLLRDLQNISKKRLDAMRFKFDNKTQKDWIRLFFNAKKRLVTNTPRRILKSKEFLCPPEYYGALKEIENKILSGDSIIMYMSDKILDMEYKDLILYDWNIHHLHLSKRRRPDGFVKRSDFELFVFFTNNIAYFIQIYPHSKQDLYSTQDMIKIIHENWPELISKHKINGLSSQKITDNEYEFFRKSGVNTFVGVDDGTIYGPIGGGYAMDGSSAEVVLESDCWKQTMHDCQELIVSKANSIIDGISRLSNKTVNRCLNIQLFFLSDDEFTFFEKSNGVCLQLYKGESYFSLCYPKDLFGSVENRP